MNTPSSAAPLKRKRIKKVTFDLPSLTSEDDEDDGPPAKKPRVAWSTGEGGRIPKNTERRHDTADFASIDGPSVDAGDEVEAEIEGRGSISIESEGFSIMPTLPLTLSRKSAAPPVDWKVKASARPVRTVLKRQQSLDVIEILEDEATTLKAKVAAEKASGKGKAEKECILQTLTLMKATMLSSQAQLKKAEAEVYGVLKGLKELRELLVPDTE